MHHDIILSFARVSQSIVGQPRLFTSYVKVMISEAKTMKQTIVTLENQTIFQEGNFMELNDVIMEEAILRTISNMLYFIFFTHIGLVG